MNTTSLFAIAALAALAALASEATVMIAADEGSLTVGVSRVDITPDYPIRLNGFGFRRTESEGVQQRIWAKAIAIGSGDEDSDDPLVLVTIDSLGVRLSIVDEVARRLAKKAGVKRERFALTFSHSHTTPKVKGACDTIFSTPIPPEHQKHIDRYTRELTDAIEKAALAALSKRRPARLSRAVGSVDFAKNRRTPGGPVDHSLPALVARAPDGSVRAILLTYACHCVTLSHNRIGGDWAGFAQLDLERRFPGAIALVSIGCGSDANPSSGVTGDKVDVAARQGAAIGAEVARLVESERWTPVRGKLDATLRRIELPLQTLPTRAEFESLAEGGGPAGFNARSQLARLGRGEKLRSAIDYPVQTFRFGDGLAMVFLGGEVCVDYALRLRRELDADRLWLHAYSNDFCSYIPSERLLTEGGYGGGAEIPYFDLPAKLAPGLEKRIVVEVERQLPKSFRAAGLRIDTNGDLREK